MSSGTIPAPPAALPRLASRLLSEQLLLARKVLDPRSEAISASDALRLAEVTLELDRHIRGGRPLPSAWLDVPVPPPRS